MEKFNITHYKDATSLRVKNARFTLYKQGENSYLLVIVRVKREGEDFSEKENSDHQEVFRGKVLVSRSLYSKEGLQNLLVLLSLTELT